MKYELILVSILACVTLISCQGGTNGSDCGPDQYCAVDVGLICEDKKCVCAKGRFEQNLETQLDFDMVWITARHKCMGNRGSLCMGTRQHPNPNGIECRPDLTCVQLPDLPNGQGTCKEIPSTSSFGWECDENRYCDASVGLICGEDNRCACGTGALDKDLSFNMTWDNERGFCVAPLGTPCVGTAMNPLPSGAEKRVECESGVCTQLQGKPPGVGICNRANDEEGPTTTPTPVPGETTTPKSDTSTAGASVVSAVTYFVLLSSFILIAHKYTLSY